MSESPSLVPDGVADPFGGYARFYDLDYADLDADLELIGQFALRCGSPILELACGTGRALLPLARAGYQVTGVDISAAMLEVAQRKIAEEGFGSRITLVHQDLRTLALEQRFAMAFVAVNSFMHLLTLQDQLAALERFRQHLCPGGLLLLDLFNPDPDRLLEEGSGQVFLDKIMFDPDTGHRLMKFCTRTVDMGTQISHVTFIVDELDAEGHVLRTLFPFSMRFLYRSELELLLQRAGFEIEAIYGSYELDEFNGDSERMIAVARNPDWKVP
jgi:SAM-dependent methyltransferase